MVCSIYCTYTGVSCGRLNDDRRSVSPMTTNSLERALALLELLEQAPGGLRNADICRHLQIPASTTSYILAKLQRRGYVRRNVDTRRYQIGLQLVALAHGALRELGFRAIAEPVLYRLSGDTGLSAGIGVLQGDSVLTVDRVEGREVLNRAARERGSDSRTREQRDIGRELPVHSTALGKVLLAYLEPQAREALLRGLKLQRITPKTITSRDRFRAEIVAVQKQGYAIAIEEQYPGVHALSVPIFDGGAVRAAVALNGGIAEPVWKDTSALIELVKIAATDIAKRARMHSA